MDTSARRCAQGLGRCITRLRARLRRRRGSASSRRARGAACGALRQSQPSRVAGGVSSAGGSGVTP
jgi:hypothetical protein